MYDPQVNVEYGVYFLSILWEEYDDETVILSAYNAGMGNVDQWLSEEEHSSDGVTLHDILTGRPSNMLRTSWKARKCTAVYTAKNLKIGGNDYVKETGKGDFLSRKAERGPLY